MNSIKPSTQHSFTELTSPKTLFKSPVFDLVTSRLHCSRTQNERDFYRFEFPGWVNVVACTENEEILIIRQFRYGTDRVELEIPGGAVDQGEDPLRAGLRELLEETGYQGENGRIIGKVCPNPALQGNSCYTVLVENVQRLHLPHFDDMEDIAVETVAAEEVFALVKDGSIHHGLVLNGLMFYAMHKGIAPW